MERLGSERMNMRKRVESELAGMESCCPLISFPDPIPFPLTPFCKVAIVHLHILCKVTGPEAVTTICVHLSPFQPKQLPIPMIRTQRRRFGFPNFVPAGVPMRRRCIDGAIRYEYEYESALFGCVVSFPDLINPAP